LADLGFRLVGRHPTVKLTFLRDGQGLGHTRTDWTRRARW
jgi:hypothetical protein